MYPVAKAALRRRYPANEGWKVLERPRREGYEPDFMVERQTPRGKERIVVEVKAACIITKGHIRQLNSYAKKLAGGGVRCAKKILVVPAGADASAVADDTEVIYLRSFRCE